MSQPTQYADIFALRGRAYDEACQRFPEASRDEAELFLALADLKPGETVVDVPAAGGYLSAFVTTPDVRMIAIDPSPVMHALCRERVRESLLAPMHALPLPDASVDVVLCLAGLHHEQDLHRVFAELRRVLRPAGRLTIAEVATGTAPATFLNGFVHEHSSLGHRGTFLDDAFLGELRASGFRLSVNRAASYPWRFASRLDIGECLHRMFGIDLAEPVAIAAAVESILGVDELDDGRVGMRWTLRHVLAHPA